MKLGLKIRDLRRQAGMTQAKLAVKIGVTASAIGFWEVNRRQPDIDSIRKLSKVFDVSTDYLLDEYNENIVNFTAKDGTQKKIILNEKQMESLRNYAYKLLSNKDELP